MARRRASTISAIYREDRDSSAISPPRIDGLKILPVTSEAADQIISPNDSPLFGNHKSFPNIASTAYLMSLSLRRSASVQPVAAICFFNSSRPIVSDLLCM